MKTYRKDIINIQHGLLPLFKGGNPSRQVYLPTFIMASINYHRNYLVVSHILNLIANVDRPLMLELN